MCGVKGIVVVTGASSGIGKATALHLAQLGFHVLAGVRKPADGEALGPAVEPVIVDVTDGGQVAALAERVGDAPLAGLVNNAGIVVTSPLEAVDLDELRRQLDVNVVAQLGVTQALLPALRRGPGRVVNIGSIGGRRAVAFNGPYGMSKFAMRCMSDNLRQELRPDGVKVVLIEPGSIRTPIWSKAVADSDEVLEGMAPAMRELYGERITRFRKTALRTERMGIPAERCAKVIAKALTAQRPRAHYLVGPDARVQAQIARLPTAVSDRILRAVTGV